MNSTVDAVAQHISLLTGQRLVQSAQNNTDQQVLLVRQSAETTDCCRGKVAIVGRGEYLNLLDVARVGAECVTDAIAQRLLVIISGNCDRQIPRYRWHRRDGLVPTAVEHLAGDPAIG